MNYSDHDRRKKYYQGDHFPSMGMFSYLLLLFLCVCLCKCDGLERCNITLGVKHTHTTNRRQCSHLSQMMATVTLVHFLPYFGWRVDANAIVCVCVMFASITTLVMLFFIGDYIRSGIVRVQTDVLSCVFVYVCG